MALFIDLLRSSRPFQLPQGNHFSQRAPIISYFLERRPGLLESQQTLTSADECNGGKCSALQGDIPKKGSASSKKGCNQRAKKATQDFLATIRGARTWWFPGMPLSSERVTTMPGCQDLLFLRSIADAWGLLFLGRIPCFAAICQKDEKSFFK